MAAVSSFRRVSPSSGLNLYDAVSDTPFTNRIDVDDSDSDDEPPPAIKFSKVTQALLAEVPLPMSPEKDGRLYAGAIPRRSVSVNQAGLDTPSRAPGIRILRRASPSETKEGRGQTPPRVVHVGSRAPSSAAKRSVSVSGPYPFRPAAREPTPERPSRSDYITPGPRLARSTRIRANSNASQDEHAVSPQRPLSQSQIRPSTSSQDLNNAAAEIVRNAPASQEYATRYASHTINRTRNITADATAQTNSLRVKRAAPVGAGSLFKSKPVRRGFRRRESEENASANEEGQAESGSASNANDTPQDQSIGGRIRSRSRSQSINARAMSAEPISAHDFAHESDNASHSRPGSRQANVINRAPASSDSRPSSRQQSREPSLSRHTSVEKLSLRRVPSAAVRQPLEKAAAPATRRPSVDLAKRLPSENSSAQKWSSQKSLSYRPEQPRPQAIATDEQENVPPPTFRRNRDQEFKYLGKGTATGPSDEDKAKPRKVDETPVPVPVQQVERKVLGNISANTPHRIAPAPPPKMSVLDAATTTAGAGVTKSKKKRSHIVINGKIFTQMGKIGKGGSSDVYCVMAENYKTFALKRVKLEDCDESAVKGFKGEIDLLNKLTEVERVVRLFDWELNETKQELAVLMEKGDTDLNRLLTMRLNGPDAKFDPAFVRFHWNEMLECVQAVHEHDIVHSDLKPANFLFVQGRLKLIDFGIANAIDTDNTCNVHRDSHVGTPNYMSPESITDTNASQPGQITRDAAGRPVKKKDMRIGKSSDVWSLGCILYQMTYGRPPFAHISNQISRIMAITNPNHVIEFPERGVGDVLIPAVLRGVLRKCLNRDPDQRPKIPDLLAESNLFINPDARTDAVIMTSDMFRRVIDKVVERCRDTKRGMPTPDELSQYPNMFMSKIREMQSLNAGE